MADCLTRDEMRSLLADALPPNKRAGARAHLGACGKCLQEFDALKWDRELSCGIREAYGRATAAPRLTIAQILDGNARSEEALVSLGRHAEAESLLLDAAAQCERSEVSLRVRRRSVLTRLVELYDAWHAAEPEVGYDAKAAAWRVRLGKEGAEAWRRQVGVGLATPTGG